MERTPKWKDKGVLRGVEEHGGHNSELLTSLLKSLSLQGIICETSSSLQEWDVNQKWKSEVDSAGAYEMVSGQTVPAVYTLSIE